MAEGEADARLPAGVKLEAESTAVSEDESEDECNSSIESMQSTATSISNVDTEVSKMNVTEVLSRCSRLQRRYQMLIRRK